MSNKLPIIQSLWIGPTLTLNEQLCISSFLHHGHEFHLYCYDHVQGIPEGTIVKDANTILSSDSIFQYHSGSYAGFADWFRWELLSKYGNFWVDTDVICVKPFQFSSEIIFGLEQNDLVCPAVIGFPKGHQLCSFLANVCKNPFNPLPYDTKKKKRKKLKYRLLGRGREKIGWGEAGGPIGFTKALKYFNLYSQAQSHLAFFPISPLHWDTIYDRTYENESINLFTNTYAIHLWNEMSRRKQGFDKNDRYYSSSLIEKLRAKYLGI